MVTTPELVALRKQRQIAGYALLALLLSDVALANLGFDEAGAAFFLLTLLSLFYVWLLGSRIRSAEKNPPAQIATEENAEPRWNILAGNFLFAGLLLWLCSSNTLLADIAALVVIGVLLPLAVSAKNKSRELRRQRWARFSIYALAVSSGWVIDHRASENELSKFNSVIAAIERYQASENRYPATLDKLTPKYLSAIPTGRWGKFVFSVNENNDATITYMPMPYVHESYNFKSKIRRTWD